MSSGIEGRRLWQGSEVCADMPTTPLPLILGKAISDHKSKTVATNYFSQKGYQTQVPFLGTWRRQCQWEIEFTERVTYIKGSWVASSVSSTVSSLPPDFSPFPFLSFFGHSFTMRASFLSLLLPAAFTLVHAVVIDMEGLADTGLNTSAWVTGKVPPIDDIWCANDMQIAAKNYLPPRRYGACHPLFPMHTRSTDWHRAAYYRTGSLDETTYLNNLNIWKNVKMNGFSFRDVSNFSME